MIRIYLYTGKYGARNTVHAMVYRSGRIVASETGETTASTIRTARAYLRARRKDRT